MARAAELRMSRGYPLLRLGLCKACAHPCCYRAAMRRTMILPLFLVLTSCGQDAPPPPAVRVRLFDVMDQAAVHTAASEQRSPDSARTWSFDFDAKLDEPLWFGRPEGRRMRWDTEEAYAVEAEGGLAGGCLRIGPNVQENQSRVVMVLPMRGRARVTVSGRVRLSDNPAADTSTTREVLRLIEHDDETVDPTRSRSWPTARVSRRLDPSGWDIIETEIITEPDTRSLQVQLMHPSGDSSDSVTRFDDLVIEETPLSQTELMEHLVRRYRPRDGQEELTPWRLRVSLASEVRDAALVPVNSELGIPLVVPPAESSPRLRFHMGALPETRRSKGDGARLTVAFEHAGGTRTDLAAFEFDPKNEESDRTWLEREIDMTAVAGQSGHLVFAAQDVGGEPDELDDILVATPRVEPANQTPEAFNVLLIGVDTLRADHLSALGYERNTTPNLAALADEGVRFTQARSQAPWTLPSFSTALTSLYPSAHGAGRGGHDEWEGIDPTTIALAEVLSRYGYETAGIVANGLISPRYGLDQGFDSYYAQWAMESATNDAPRVIDFVESHTTTPWLMFWHIMDPHLNYDTAGEFHDEFTDPDYDGRFSGNHQVPFRFLDPRPGRRWFTHEGPPPAPELAEEDVKYIVDAYDAEIAEVDAAIGSLLDALRASGQWERTIVVLFADHGEGLGEHGHYHHGYTLFDDQVHVPWILRIPGSHEGRVVDRPVGVIDIAPTVLGALGVPVPDTFQGVDRLADDAPTDDAFIIEYPSYDSSAQKAWMLGPLKYMHDPVFHTEALYDTVADPAERIDVSAEHPEIVERARAELAAFRWEQLQKGRFHLRLRGEKGQVLKLRIATNDLFDANFVARPATSEHDFEMDLMRKHLDLETELSDGRFELVFWCRGSELDFEISLDGEPLEGLDLSGDEEDEERTLPAHLLRGHIDELQAESLGWPRAGRALLWLEAGAGKVLPVVNTPEEIELLRALGYSR